MKTLNAALAVAGAMTVVGAAAPAFAYDADLTPTSLNGGLNTLTSSPLDVRPVQNQDGGVSGLLGGLPLNR